MHSKTILSRLFIFLSALVLTACSAHLDIEWPADPIESLDKETADLADVTADAHDLADRAGKENVLVVFDIDNTILAMEQGLGADQWYEWQKDLDQHDRCNSENVGNRFAVQGALYFTSAMRTTQADGPSQVKD